MYDVIVIGGGASGMSAALYCKRAGMSVLIIERELFGGQINNTGLIENYIGVGNITGEELSQAMYNQIEENKIEVTYGDVKSITTENDIISVNLSNREFESKSVVLATGVKHRELEVDGEKEYQGFGVSYCAICDGFAFKDKDVIVIGGGDSAFEEGLFLSDIAKSVTLIYYKGEENLKAKEELYDKFINRENTKTIYNSKISKIVKSKDDRMVSYFSTSNDVSGKNIYSIVNQPDNKIFGIVSDGIFIYIGVEPVNELAEESQIALDDSGYVLVDDKYMTNIKNVFAIGDLIHKDIKQVSIAVSDGAFVSKYIKEALQ